MRKKRKKSKRQEKWEKSVWQNRERKANREEREK